MVSNTTITIVVIVVIVLISILITLKYVEKFQPGPLSTMLPTPPIGGGNPPGGPYPSDVPIIPPAGSSTSKTPTGIPMNPPGSYHQSRDYRGFHGLAGSYSFGYPGYGYVYYDWPWFETDTDYSGCFYIPSDKECPNYYYKLDVGNNGEPLYNCCPRYY